MPWFGAATRAPAAFREEFSNSILVPSLKISFYSFENKFPKNSAKFCWWKLSFWKIKNCEKKLPELLESSIFETWVNTGPNLYSNMSMLSNRETQPLNSRSIFFSSKQRLRQGCAFPASTGLKGLNAKIKRLLQKKKSNWPKILL